MVKTADRLRLEVPLYQVAEAARIIDVSASGLSTLAEGKICRSEAHAYVAGDPITAPTGIPQDQVLLPLATLGPT